jgi:molybdopterin-guanine dinucleotide biosynthesis protein MobB
VIGRKHSGKTTAIEALVKGLIKHGYKIATIKHVSQKSFTMDTEGKDTWRHARAGAIITTTVAANEIATIRKGDTSKYEINDIVKPFENRVDIVIFEGFRKLVKEEKIPKIVAVKNKEEAFEASEQFKPIIAFVGPFSTEKLDLKAPYIDVTKNPDKLTRLVIEKMKLEIKKVWEEGFSGSGAVR